MDTCVKCRAVRAVVMPAAPSRRLDTSAGCRAASIDTTVALQW
jgi:hypothetical protein